MQLFLMQFSNAGLQDKIEQIDSHPLSCCFKLFDLMSLIIIDEDCRVFVSDDIDDVLFPINNFKLYLVFNVLLVKF
jgi:hypothetical protein